MDVICSSDPTICYKIHAILQLKPNQIQFHSSGILLSQEGVIFTTPILIKEKSLNKLLGAVDSVLNVEMGHKPLL